MAAFLLARAWVLAGELRLVKWTIREVVAQIIKAELVIRAVGHVREVCLAPRDRAQEILLYQKAPSRVARLVKRFFVFFLRVPLRVVEERRIGHEAGHAKTEGAVDLAHPYRVAPGKIFIHRHHVHAHFGEGVEVRGSDRGKGFSFSGHHLGDRAFVERHAAQKLDVKRPLAERPFCRFPHERKRSREERVKRFFRPCARPQGEAFFLESFVAERLYF